MPLAKGTAATSWIWLEPKPGGFIAVDEGNDHVKVKFEGFGSPKK